MPHYVVPPAGAAMAHGLIQLTLSPGANAKNAMAAVRGVTEPAHLKIATVSHFEKEHPPQTPVAAGDIIAVFVNSTDPIKSTTAHDAMHTLAGSIGALPFFAGQPKHW